MATISTHNGSSVSRGHNLRKEEIVSKEKHIDPDGMHETWIDEAPRQAYERIFGQAVAQYNKKQSRADRQIKDYYNHVRNDKKKHCVYEMIIGVYPAEGENVSEHQEKEILKEFVSNWHERNPNLELIGAYYHADEQGKAPHVHVDYIPVAHGYAKGPETQNGIVKALGEQGFRKRGKETAQIQWEKRENEYLEKLCNRRGIAVEHPLEGKGVNHLHTAIFKAQKELDRTEEQLKSVTKTVAKKVSEETARAVECAKIMYGDPEDIREQSEKLTQQVDILQGQIEASESKLADLEQSKSRILKETIHAMKEKQDAERTLQTAQESILKARDDLKTLREQIGTDTGRLDALQGQIKASEDKLKVLHRQKEEAEIEAKAIIDNAMKESGLDRLNAKIDEKLGLISMKEVSDKKQQVKKAVHDAKPYLSESDKDALSRLDYKHFDQQFGKGFKEGAKYSLADAYTNGTPDKAIFTLINCLKEYVQAKESPHSVEEIRESIEQSLNRRVKRHR